MEPKKPNYLAILGDFRAGRNGPRYQAYAEQFELAWSRLMDRGLIRPDGDDVSLTAKGLASGPGEGLTENPNPTIGDDYMEAVGAALAPFHDRFLLTGAGFAKPWGGYLAQEFWDLLISDPVVRELPKVDDLLHRIMPFEDALAEMEVTRRGDYSDDDRAGLRGAVRRAFELHDRNLCENGAGAPGLLNRFVERFVEQQDRPSVYPQPRLDA